MRNSAVQKNHQPSIQHSIWSNTNFIKLWLGGTFSVLGYRLYSVLISWFVIELTGSTSVLGTLFVFWSIPNMIFMIGGGALSDNFNKVKIMWYSDVFRAISLTILFILYLNDISSITILFIISTIFGISNAMFTPARDALLPEILSTDHIQKGNSLREMINQVAIVIGPVIAGFGVKILGVGEAFVIPIGFMVLSALFIQKINYSQPTKAKKESKVIIKEIKEGFNIVRKHSGIAYLFICMAIFNLGFFGPLVIGLPYLSNKVLKVGIEGFTFLEVSIAVGMIIASIISTKYNFYQTGKISFTSTIICGVLFSLVGYANNLLIIGAMLGIIGGLITVVNILMYSTVQKTFDSRLLGTVLGFLNFMVVGMDPVSFFVSGIAFEYLNTNIVFLIGGTIVALSGLVGIIVKKTRNLKTI